MNSDTFIQFFKSVKTYKGMYIGEEDYPPIMGILAGMHFALRLAGVTRSAAYESLYRSVLNRYGLESSALSAGGQLVRRGASNDEIADILLAIESFLWAHGAYVLPKQASESV